MKKMVLIPDSFKGTLSSVRICGVLTRAAQDLLPGVTVCALPVGDGGEGTAEAFLRAAGGQRIPCRVKGPLGAELTASYALLPDGTAVVEMAAAAGLPLCGHTPDPMRATTYGVGQLIADAAQRGCRSLILGLGGSATNDGGCGAACALGVQFCDSKGAAFLPTGATLEQIHTIDCSHLDPTVQHLPITCMCDIDNPLYGENGAAAVFAPQKGATPDQVRQLDRGLRHLAGKLLEFCQIDVSVLPGAGAAGGMGGGCAALLRARLKSGIETVLDTVRLDQRAGDADLILTGEGKIDRQSVRGKVVCGVARRAQALKIPCIALVGDAGEGYETLYEQGLTAVFSINRTAAPYKQARLRAEQDLYRTACDVFRLIRQYTP